MSQEKKSPLKAYILSVIIVVLLIASVSIAWRLFTANYPTHSDVFFMGVECGALLVVLLICLFLICLLLYRLATLWYRFKAARRT
jgi:uncharacterized membrane protein